MLKNKLFLIIGICLVLSNFSFAQEETQQPVLEEVKESVTCIFTNTDLAQACYPNIGTPCKGTNSCTTTISGARGTQITWKSSCGSYASTTLDGNNEEIKFECPTLNPILIQQPPTLTQPTPIPPLEPSETKAEIVRCVFTNSNLPQKCYSSLGNSCEGIGSCKLEISGAQGMQVAWKSSCNGYSTTLIDGAFKEIKFDCLLQSTPVPIQSYLKEQITCIFSNSNSLQKCYTTSGPFFSCYGINSCTMDISGTQEAQISWQSSCGGYTKTVITGSNKEIKFDCSTQQAQPIQGIPQLAQPPSQTYPSQPIQSPQKLITEQVKCGFINSNVLINPHTSTESCYTTDDKKYACQWTGNVMSKQINGETVKQGYCIALITGERGTKLNWKSSCGNYASTIIDGNNEDIDFMCIPSSEVTEDQIKGKGFKYASWKCYDNTESSAAISEAGTILSCKTSEEWQKIASVSCNAHCYTDENSQITKCGVNSFSVSKECYLDENSNIYENNPQPPQPTIQPIQTMPFQEPQYETPIEEKMPLQQPENILMCKDSCPLDEKCYPFGYRKNEKFCSDEGNFKEQKVEEITCENNFECKTNVCVDEKCIGSSLIKQMINFFKK